MWKLDNIIENVDERLIYLESDSDGDESDLAEELPTNS